MKYNELKVNWGGNTFIFVTKEAEVFSKEEALMYLHRSGVCDTSEEVRGKPSEEVEVKPAWKLPNDKQRIRIFMRDLKEGIDFCTKKYGVSDMEIIAEAKRVAPHYDVTRKLNAQKSNA